MKFIPWKPHNSFFGPELINSFLKTGFAVIQTKDYFDPEIYEITGKIFNNASLGEMNRLIQNGKIEYYGFGKENAKDQSKPDLKEFIHIKDLPVYADIPGLSFMENWVVVDTKYKLWKMARKIFEIVLEYVDYNFDIKESVEFYNKTNENSILRLLHYPALQNIEPGSVRAAAHEDINLITILLGTHEPGLQVYEKDSPEGWIDIPAGDSNTVVVNVGDMLQSITNGLFKSTTHRVINVNMTKPRYSLPYFFHADPHVNIGPIKEIVDATGGKNYPDRTAKDYLDERLKEIGLKK